MVGPPGRKDLRQDDRGQAAKHVDEIKIDPNVSCHSEMERKLGTRIPSRKVRGRGRSKFEYYSAEDLDCIYDTIMGEP
jgi:hypothetical protein